MSEADLEYGPTPEGAEHEHTDIEPSIATRFALWLAVALVLAAGIVYAAFWLFEDRELTAGQAAQIFPLAAGEVREPIGPRLQTQPFQDVYLLQQAERERLTSYGWVDQGAGVVHIPIDEALRLIGERGLVPSSGETPAELNRVVQDSSAGRTAAPRE